MTIPTSDYGPLKAGAHYRVIQAFTDFDGGRHEIGERWRFVGSSFLPYEDGLSLFVETADGAIRQIGMRCTNEDQGVIAAAFEDYLSPG